MPVYRIDKILTDMGISSRRQVKTYIKLGRVAVNGRQIASPDIKCDTDSDIISVDGQIIHYEKYIYLMLNKPTGVISATEDEAGKTVIDLLDESIKRLRPFPVGRLDKDVEGLLIITNDGDFCHRIASPRHKIVKTYYVETVNTINRGAVEEFKRGLVLGDGEKCLPAELQILDINKAHLSISEGKYHQVKKMMAKAGSPVKYLKRISIGGLLLDPNLDPGMYRRLSDEECRSIFVKEKNNMSY